MGDGRAPDDGMAPPWLEPLLVGRHDLVVEHRDPFWAVQRMLPADDVAALGTDGFLLGVPTTYFALVDALDTDAVLSAHALVWEPDTLAGGAWWTLVEGGWLCERPERTAGSRLRWIQSDEVAAVTGGIDLFFAQQRQARRPTTIRRRITAAVESEGVDVIDLEPIYVQWAGFPAGVHLEVGDGKTYEQPLDPQLGADLRWLGWRMPGQGNRNAWFEVVGPDAVDLATDLVVRTLTVLEGVETRRRSQRGLELMRGPASSGLIARHGDHLRVHGRAAGQQGSQPRQ